MNKATIYRRAWYYTLQKIEEEVAKVVEAEKNGKPHKIADSRLARYYIEEEEIRQMLLKAEKESK